MNTKKILKKLVKTGMRLTILASLIMTAIVTNVTSVIAAPAKAINGLSVSTQTGSLSVGTAGSVTYQLSLTRDSGFPNNTSPLIWNVVGLPAGASATFNNLAVWSGTTRPYQMTINTTAATPAGSFNFSVEVSTTLPIGGSATADGLLVVDSFQVTPTITFGAAPSPLFPGPDFTVNATSDSDGALTYSFVSGPCFLVDANSGLFSPTGAGDCVVQADTAATASYLAGSEQQTVSITASVLTTPTITFDTAPAPEFPGPDFNVNATTDSDGAITYSFVSGPCTLVDANSGLFSPTGTGDCVVQADTAATATFLAGSEQQTVSITGSALLTPTITFDAAPSPVFPGPDFTVSATTDSDGLLTYSFVSGPCNIVDANAGTFSLTGTGDCVVQADTAATATFLAGSAQQTVSIGSIIVPDVSFDLYAVTGTASLPGQSVTIWAYTTDGSSATQPGGPVLVVNQGDTVSISLHNQLVESTALLIQGQSIIPDLIGTPAGDTKIYTFTADKPGTFLYEAGLLPNAQHQVAMGLYGALLVRPAGSPTQAYENGSTAFDTEQVLILSELDPELNNSGDPAAFDIRNYDPKYYLINGKTYPDTDDISVAAGEILLLRYVNAGLQAHSMSTLGLTQTIIAQDGHANTHGRLVVAETIATGQTLDTLVNVGIANGAQYPLYDASLFLGNNSGSGAFAGLGGMLTMINVGTVTPPGDSMGPVASSLSLSPNPTDGTVEVALTATISEVTTGGSNISAAEYFIDTTAADGSGSAMTGAFNSSTDLVNATISSATLAGLSFGDHTIFVHGQDSTGNWGAFANVTLTLQLVTPPPAIGSLYFSVSGITLSGPNGVDADAGDIYIYDGAAFIGVLVDAPTGANVDGFDYVGTNQFYMSFTGNIDLPGIGTVQKEDVVYFDGANWLVFFDGTSNGLASSNIDAISILGSDLFFSTNNTDLPSGVTGVGDDADIYTWNGSSIERVFDASALGWSGHNVDGLVYIDATHFYLSYSPTSTIVSGLGTVQDEDVVYYENGVWSMYFDGTSKGLTQTALDVDAFDNP